MAEVVVGVGGHEVVAAVTRRGVERLALDEEDDVVVFVKATEVMLGKDVEA
jgi:molybdopterin-binding protein